MKSNIFTIQDNNKKDSKIDIDILLINDAYGTGIKFDSEITFMIIHSYADDIRTQVKGRYSGDLKLVYYPDKEIDDGDLLIIPQEYLNRDLYSKDKKKLYKELNLKNKSNGRLLKWTSISKIICLSFHFVYFDASLLNTASKSID